MIKTYLDQIPEGYSQGLYQGSRYGVSKEVYNHGRSFKIFGEELGGNDYISLNVYLTTCSDLLKPCEMSRVKVLDFLKKFEVERPD